MRHNMNRFIYCPRCDSGELEITDYEDENGDEDTDGRRCLKCNWEGDVHELVCREDEDNERDQAHQRETDNRTAQDIDERRG